MKTKKQFVVISGPTISDWQGVPQSEVEAAESPLSFLQRKVGGLIERVPIQARAAVWVNEEGKLLNLPVNALWTDAKGRLIDGLAGSVVIEFGNHADLERVKMFVRPARLEPWSEIVS